MSLNVSLGKSKWVEAEYHEKLANAYRVAASAAEEIEEHDIAKQWRNTAIEVEQRAVQGFSLAKSLGYFGA